MSFDAPGRLVLVAVPVALALTYLRAQRRRLKYVVRFTNMDLLESVAPRQPGFRRHLPAIALLGSVLVLVLGLAQPVRIEEVARTEGVLVLAVDVSPSMMAEDVPPNRYAAAQAAVDRFIGLLPRGVRLGLVIFAGTAQVAVPPTSDHELVRRAMANQEFRSETALGEAIHASLDALALGTTDDEVPAAGVVLMSDGASTTGRPFDSAAERARELGVPVSTISFGTGAGTVVLNGRTVRVPPDPEALDTIARLTEGRAFEAATAEELAGVYQTIGRSVQTVEERRSLTEWFLAGGLILALLAGGLSLVWFSRLP